MHLFDYDALRAEMQYAGMRPVTIQQSEQMLYDEWAEERETERTEEQYQDYRRCGGHGTHLMPRPAGNESGNDTTMVKSVSLPIRE